MRLATRPIPTGAKPRPRLESPTAVHPDLHCGRHLSPAPDQLWESQVTGTAQVAGLPLVTVPDVEYMRPGCLAVRPKASARSEKLATG